jgi:hypothetical protein
MIGNSLNYTPQKKTRFSQPGTDALANPSEKNQGRPADLLPSDVRGLGQSDIAPKG